MKSLDSAGFEPARLRSFILAASLRRLVSGSGATRVCLPFSTTSLVIHYPIISNRATPLATRPFVVDATTVTSYTRPTVALGALSAT